MPTRGSWRCDTSLFSRVSPRVQVVWNAGGVLGSSSLGQLSVIAASNAGGG